MDRDDRYESDLSCLGYSVIPIGVRALPVLIGLRPAMGRGRLPARAGDRLVVALRGRAAGEAPGAFDLSLELPGAPPFVGRLSLLAGAARLSLAVALAAASGTPGRALALTLTPVYAWGEGLDLVAISAHLHRPD